MKKLLIVSMLGLSLFTSSNLVLGAIMGGSMSTGSCYGTGTCNRCVGGRLYAGTCQSGYCNVTNYSTPINNTVCR